MGTTLDQERAFYDGVYAQFLELPDHSLRCDRAILETELADPSRPIYERRRLYAAVLGELLAEPVAGLRVLDYGCGPGEWGLVLAGEGARVTFLDLSPVAIQLALRRAAASGVARRVDGIARDASDLSCFADGQFDLIFGGAAMHHTLKYGRAADEIVRVLRPGGRLVLAETYGNNPLLNLARRARWRLHGVPEEAGEEILFGAGHIAELRRRLSSVEVTPLNLFAMAKRLFRGRFTSRPARAAMAGLESLDRLVLGAAPFLRRYCGEVLVVGRK